MTEKNVLFEKNFYEKLRKGESVKIDLKEIEGWYFGNYLKSGNIRAFRNRLALKYLKKYVKTGGNFLEYGCGNGNLSLYFSKFWEKVIGFDLSEVSVKLALEKREYLNIENVFFFCGDASNLGMKDSSVDIVFGHGILHHLKKYDGIGEELFRILKRGGVAIFAENLGENKVLEMIRKKIWEKKGLIGIEDTLKYKDIYSIGNKFDVEVIELSFFSTIKRVLGYRNIFVVRIFIYLIFYLDQILLKIFPFLSKYCAESVIIFKKK